MKIEYKEKGDNFIFFIKEEDDPKFYTESRLWFTLKKFLNQYGFDLIKKEPSKDGHLTSSPYYLRARNKYSAAPHVYIYDPNYAVKRLYESWNKGEIIFYIEYDIWNRQPNCKEIFYNLIERIINHAE